MGSLGSRLCFLGGPVRGIACSLFLCPSRFFLGGCSGSLCSSFCLFGLSNGVELRIHAVQSGLGCRIAGLELQRFFIFITGIFPTRTRLGPLAVFHGIVVAHLGTLQVIGQLGQAVQLVVDATTHVVGVVQIELNPATALVKRRDADGCLHDALVEPLDHVKQGHVQVEHEPLGQFSLWRAGTVDGHPLGHEAFGAEHNHVIVTQRQIEKVLSIAVHLNFVEGFPPSKDRHRDVVETLFGLLMLQASTHHERT